MAYKQKNKPFNFLGKLHSDLQSFGERHSAWREKRKEKSQQKGDDGLTNFERHMAEKKRMRKTGESKFQYDVRMRRERSKLAKTDSESTAREKFQQKVKKEGPVEVDFSLTGQDFLDQTNPNDKRDQSKPQNFGIVPGMTFGEAFAQAGKTAKKGDIFFWQDKPFLYDFKNEETVDANPYISQKYAIDPFAGEEYDPTYKRKKDTSGKKEKQLRFPELGKYHYKNSPSYKGE